MLTRAATVQLALSKVGVAESPPGSNRVEFSRWYGLIGPWCAMYLSWALDRAGNDSGYRFASTASSVAWARRTGRLVPVDQARPGDVLVRLYTPTTGHTGMATEPPRSGTQVTVEGNTSGANDRDGGRVMVRRRSASWWQYCIRLDYPTTPQEATVAFDLDGTTPVPGGQPDALGRFPFWGWRKDGSVFAFNGAPGPVPTPALKAAMAASGPVIALHARTDGQTGYYLIAGEPGENSTWSTYAPAAGP